MTLRHDIGEAARVLAQLIASIPTRPKTVSDVPARGSPEALLFNLEHNPGANVTLALRHLEDAIARAERALEYAE